MDPLTHPNKPQWKHDWWVETGPTIPLAVLSLTLAPEAVVSHTKQTVLSQWALRVNLSREL